MVKDTRIYGHKVLYEEDAKQAIRSNIWSYESRTYFKYFTIVC